MRKTKVRIAEKGKCPKCWRKVEDLKEHISTYHSLGSDKEVWFHPKAQLRFSIYRSRECQVDNVKLERFFASSRRLPVWSLDFNGDEFSGNDDWDGWIQIILDEKQLRILKQLIERELQALGEKE